MISSFNQDTMTAAPINHIVLYGSDVEISYDEMCCTPAGDTKKFGRSLTDSMSRRLEQYSEVSNDTTLTFIIDGRMDGGEVWSPDLSKLSTEEVVEWSRWMAQWICAYDRIDGVQLDLEPLGTQYRWDANFRLLASELGNLFASRDYGCISPRRPDGVALSTFALASSVDVGLMQAMGPNGYVVISGYDLGTGGAGSPNPPSTYEANLRAQLASIKATSAKSGVPYMVGIPAAASTYEFETYLKDGQLISSGYNQVDYIKRALSALRDICNDDPNYLGPMLWTLTYTNVYPPHSANVMRPQSAWSNGDVWTTLKTGLGIGPPPPSPPTRSPATKSPTRYPKTDAPADKPPTITPSTGSPTDNPTPNPTSDWSYARDGCRTDADCLALGGSYCKTYKTDACGRAACHGIKGPDPKPGCK